MSEITRYLEYLFIEKKWGTAQNISSLLEMSSLVNYKPQRKKSSSGFVIVSHSDDAGNKRLPNLGKSFFNLNDPSNYDNSATAETGSEFITKTLVPWRFSSTYLIPKGTVFTTNSGIEYISTQTVQSRTFLTENYSDIINDEEKLDIFNTEGAWEGIKYLKVPVLQGKLKQLVITNQGGLPFSTVDVNSRLIEDASTKLSKDFFSVTVAVGSATPQEYFPIIDLSLAGPDEKVFQIINSRDFSKVVLKFGDGITGTLLPLNSTVTVNFLETLGTGGNISKKYQVNKVLGVYSGVNIVTNSIIDPRNGQPMQLDVTNIDSIIGGINEESIEDIRRKAPLEYLKFYTIATSDSYEKQIANFSQIALSQIKIFGGQFFDVNSQINKDVLYITCITTDGKKVTDPQNELIIPISLSIGDLKSPTDSLYYIEPEFIKLKMNITIFTESSSVSDEEVITSVKSNVLQKYSIFNSEFKKPFYYSDFITTISNLDFVTYTESYIEAISEVGFTEYDTLATGTNIKYRFYFDFNKIYGRDEFAKGFKNYKTGTSYLLKIELINLNPNFVNLDRTIFLLDNRNLYTGAPTTLNVEYSLAHKYDGTSNAIDIEQTNDFNKNRLMRVAQFDRINFITDEKTIQNQILPFDKVPKEIRPFKVDINGNKVIPEEIDSRFINGLNIYFNEDFDIESEEFAKGYIDIPGSYYSGLQDIDYTNKLAFVGWLKENVTIKIFAKPIIENIVPSEWNEIIFADNSDIFIERNVTWLRSLT